MINKTIIHTIAMLLFAGTAIAQIPVEVFAGNKKATFDVLFFKFFKNKEGQNSKFLFFNRNRASIDYAMTETTNLPQFAFTEAISYNREKLKGFAPVVVANIFNRGIFSKAGIQFARIKKDYILFSWVVTETSKDPNIDFFFLGRYIPKITDKINLFSQIELFNALPTAKENIFSFTQRFRLGLKIKEFQFGAGLDLTESGRDHFITTQNMGGFLRYEF
jgi:hypothetical protein